MISQHGVVIPTAGQVMEQPVATSHPEETLNEVIVKLLRHKLPALPVIDQNDNLVGIISYEHILEQIIKGVSLGEPVISFIDGNNLPIIASNEVLTLDKISAKFLLCVCQGDKLLGVVYLDKMLAIYNSRIKTLAPFENLSKEYERIFNNCYDSIFVTDEHGEVLWVNAASVRITGQDFSDVIGKNVSSLEKKQVFFPSVTNLVIKNKKPQTILQRVSTGQDVVVTGTPVFDEAGELVRVVAVTRDIKKLIDEVKKYIDSAEYMHLCERLKKLNQLNQLYYGELKELRRASRVKEKIIAASKVMQNILRLAKNVAAVDTTILILGESGVGKDVIARRIHDLSERCEGPFMEINCGAIPETLLESELFGYEAGAFTGARKETKLGLIEMANGGTLFLNEIAELPLQLQVKLLQTIQERKFYRVGSTKPRQVDIRIIAATNRDLEKMVDKGTFRADLFYRLNVVPITIPPLRQRKDDIPPLLIYFLEKYNHRYNRNKQLSSQVIDFLCSYQWPGNIRQLENLVERLVVVGDHRIISIADLPKDMLTLEKVQPLIDLPDEIVPLKETLEMVEATLIKRAMKKYKSTTKAAEVLGINQSTVVRKLQKYRNSNAY